MNLIDILARVLKDWPDHDATCITQDDDGYIFAWTGSPDRGSDQWLSGSDYKLSKWRYGVIDLACDSETSIVTRAQWQEARDALNKPVVEAWNGEGLPPVDLPVEWYSDSNTGWQEIVVLAYHGDDAWIQPKGKESTIVYNIANFRPIRTPEQIAADERLHKLRNAHIAIAKTLDAFKGDIPAESVSRQTIEAMIDAGYVKL